MIQIDHLTFAYNDEPVLRDLSLTVARGDALLIRGASGCGKSTLLRVLARLEAPRSGSIRLDGIDVADIPSPAYRRRVAYLQQLPVMLEGSIRENLLLPFRYGADSAPGDDVLRAQLAEVELHDAELDAPATELSVGQQQRVALLRLLLMKPDVLLLDEPTASLDAASASLLMQLVNRQLHQHSHTMLIVSHQELSLRDRSLRHLRMEAGRLEEAA